MFIRLKPHARTHTGIFGFFFCFYNNPINVFVINIAKLTFFKYHGNSRHILPLIYKSIYGKLILQKKDNQNNCFTVGGFLQDVTSFLIVS